MALMRIAEREVLVDTSDFNCIDGEFVCTHFDGRLTIVRASRIPWRRTGWAREALGEIEVANRIKQQPFVHVIGRVVGERGGLTV